MRTLGFLAALALATAAPAMAMSSAPSSASMSARQCLRRVDARGNIRVICPNMTEARAAWIARRASYPGNYVVYYRDGTGVREWRRWMKHEHKR
jgi:hypothetical protein